MADDDVVDFDEELEDEVGEGRELRSPFELEDTPRRGRGRERGGDPRDGAMNAVLEEVLETFGASLGALGYELPIVQRGLSILQGAIGRRMTSMGLAGMNVFGRTGIQAALAAAGVRPDVAEIFGESIGSVFEGVRWADYANARNKGELQRLRKQLREQTKIVTETLRTATFEDVVTLLPEAARRDLKSRLQAMSEEDRSRFNGYKRRLNSGPLICKLLAETAARVTAREKAEWLLRDLATWYGKPVTAEMAVASGIEKTAATLRAAQMAASKGLDAILGSEADRARVRARRAALMH